MKTLEQKISLAGIIIDLLGLLLSIIMSFNDDNTIFWIIIAVLIIVNIVFILLFLNSKKQLHMFKVILSQNIPLYGLLNYLIKKKDENGSKYVNNLKILSLTLKAKLVGDIREKKNNDLLFSWTINGSNIQEEPISSFFLRIGADSSVNDDNLVINAYNCSECKKQTNCEECCLSDEEKINRKMLITKELNTKTYRMLKLNLNEPVHQGHTFTVRLEYVWPQCYNSVCDFLLIDPNNFATNIDKIKTRIECDNKIINKSSQISLAELDKVAAKTSIIKKISYKDNAFEYAFTPENKKLYYLVIINKSE